MASFRISGQRARRAPPTVQEVTDIPTVADLWDRDLLKVVDTEATYDAHANMRVSVWRGDITTIAADVIVNAANRSLLGGGGVDGAIHSAAGPGLREECRTLGGAQTGETKLTRAYKLPSKYIAHTVGPIYSSAHESDCRRLLRSCYRGSLDWCARVSGQSIAFSSISTGIYGYPLIQATHIAVGEARRWVQQHSEIDHIIFVVFSPKDEQTYREIIPYYFPGPPEDTTEVAELEAAAAAAESVHDEANSARVRSSRPPVIQGRPIDATPDSSAIADNLTQPATPAQPERSVSPLAAAPTAEEPLADDGKDRNGTSAEVAKETENTETDDIARYVIRPTPSTGHVKGSEEDSKLVKGQGASHGQDATETKDVRLEDVGPVAPYGNAQRETDRTTSEIPDTAASEDEDWVKVDKEEGAAERSSSRVEHPEEEVDPANPESGEDIDWPASSQTLVDDATSTDKGAQVKIEVNIKEEEEHKDEK